jgi:L-lactate dehydrogenase (cytochrome)
VKSLRAFQSVVRFGVPETNLITRRLSRAANIDDLRRIAKRRLPRGIFDYYDGAALDEVTLQRNTSSFSSIEYRPRVLRDVSRIDTSVNVFNSSMSMPVMLSPTGFGRIAHSDGELAVARAASDAGLHYSLSTLGTRSIEEIGSIKNLNKWFQVYAWRDRGLIAEMINRAKESGYLGLQLTVDTPVFGRRERDIRRGFTLPPKIGPRTILDGILHPEWTLDFLRHDPITFAVVAEHQGLNGETAVTLADFINSQFDPSLSWDDVAWIRDQWDGPILLKGIQSPEDAELATQSGVDGIMVSNHGGRQLDGSPPIIELIEPIAHAVNGRIAVVCDGGIRRGGDVFKALALGADCVSIGRAYLYGLGAAGERGVRHALEILRKELEMTMALVGVTDVQHITRDTIRWRTDPHSS